MPNVVSADRPRAQRTGAPPADSPKSQGTGTRRAENPALDSSVKDGFEVEKTRRVRKHRIDRSGATAEAASVAEPLAPGDPRTYSDINTLASDQNLLTPLFPDLLVDPKGPDAYNASMMKAIREAKSFVVVEGYDLNRDDFVDALIKKAREGVEVAVLFDPVNTPREEKKGQLLDRMRKAGLPNLHVAEYGIVPKSTKAGFDQILHVKKVITDTPDGSIAEHSGGINFSPNSIHNLDFGWRAEGLAVIDSLRRIVSHWQSTTGDFPIDLKKIPDWNFVESNSRAKAKTAPGGPVEIEIASAGKLPMEKPHTYSKAKLTERAQLGKKIIISAEQASKPAVQETLAMAVENGSRVWVIESANEDKEAFAPTKKALKDMGVQVFHEGDVILEDSYFELVCRELDQAIRDKSPIQMAAFALSHPEIIDRLIAAHDAGSDVRVVVDDLQIDGSLINKKAMAQLSAAGVPVRGVDRDVKAEIAREWGGDAPQLKLHAKYLGVGGDRVLAGSANFSDNGMSNNVEDGRLIRSEAVAKKVSDTLFEPLWAKSKPVEPIRVVPDHQRVPLLDPVPAGTPPSDVTIVVMDLETTGFVAKHDDRLLQISARAMKLGADGEVEVLEDFDQVVTPGINQLGHPFAIPKQISALVGLDESNLESRGALPVQEAVLAFIEFIGRQKEGGPTILAGQNLPFDIRFLDHVLSREQLGVPKGDDTVHYTLDGPYMDCIDISKRAFPEADSHNLDAHMARLDVPLDPKLPRHDAFPDVVYTSEVLGKLIFKVEAKAIDTLLPPDLIELDGPRMLFSSPRKSGNALHELNFNDKDKLQIEVRDPRSGKLGGSKRVYDLQVTGRKNGRLEVAVTTGRGDRTEVTKGWIDEGNLTFRSGGRFYHKMRQEGQALPKPTILTS